MRWSMPESLPVFDARLKSLETADDLLLVIDKRHGDFAEKHIKLLGVAAHTPEPGSSEAGMKAKDFALRWFAEGALAGGAYPFTVHTFCRDQRGRWLARVWRKLDGEDLTAALLEAGHGTPVSDMRQVREGKQD